VRRRQSFADAFQSTPLSEERRRCYFILDYQASVSGRRSHIAKQRITDTVSTINKTVDTVRSSLTLKHRAPKKFYEPGLKAQVVAERGRVGSSIAGVALSHGVNVNMVHRWLDEHEAGIGWVKRVVREAQFVEIAMEPSAVMQECASSHALPINFIEIELT
jgi:transposase-like protein